jgi:L-methionine (R)-S-oxide reductase
VITGSDITKKIVDERQLFNALIAQITEIAAKPQETNEKLFSVCRLLKDNIPYYNWVGFYLLDQPRELALGPFVGEPTEHVRIPFGKGLCGQAAERTETFIAQDVSQEAKYLSCSPHVKSEIVVPVVKKKELVGVLDIDSHIILAFTKDDRAFLKQVCELVSALF